MFFGGTATISCVAGLSSHQRVSQKGGVEGPWSNLGILRAEYPSPNKVNPFSSGRNI